MTVAARAAALLVLTMYLLSACAQTYPSCQQQPSLIEASLPEGCRVQWEGPNGGAYFVCNDRRKGFAG